MNEKTDPINKLIGSCNIVGKECDELVEARKKGDLNDLGFISEYFTLLEKMPASNKKEEIIKELEEFIVKKEL